MRSPHYVKADISAALDQLPLERGGVVYIHSNIGFFGRMEGGGSIDDICEAFFEAIQKRLGPGGTIVVPVFTNCFADGEPFDPAGTISTCGAFSEWVRQRDDASRSVDPFYSVSSVGPLRDQIIKGISNNSFDENSIFSRFHELNGSILNLNFDAGSTFIHYVERQLKIPYRFDKRFTGTIIDDGVATEHDWTIWVRYLSDDALVASFEAFDSLARDKNLWSHVGLGRGQIGMISAIDTFDLIKESLPTRPWLLTKADGIVGFVPSMVEET